MEKAKHRNGIRYSQPIHQKALELRKEGKTHREISTALKISLGSADLWTRGILLSTEQKIAIHRRRNQRAMSPKERQEVSKRLKLFWQSRKYTREDLIEKIKRFYDDNGRIPLKREFNSLQVFKNHFGSWNDAIKVAGFDPNPILFAKKFISQDYHRCDSFSEKIIDDWLFKKDIYHERHWHYGETKMTGDFFISPNTIIEFFGLAGVQKKYDANLMKKRKFCIENNIRLIELYPDDIFPVNRLEYILGSFY